MYLPIVLHSLCIIQILMISMQDPIWAHRGALLVVNFTIKKHDYKGYTYHIYLNPQSIFLLCYLLLSQNKQLPEVKESMEKSSSQQSIESV